MRILRVLALCGAAIVLSGCVVGISRKGYKLPPGSLTAQAGPEVVKRSIPIKVNMYYDPSEVDVLGSIRSYDTGFSIHCDEATVLNIFREEGSILGADVINITEEKQPNVWGSSCYRAKAQFLRFKDRTMAYGLVSDPKYSPDLVDARSEEIDETLKNYSEVTTEAGRLSANGPAGAINGAIAGTAYGVVGGVAYRPVNLTSKDIHAMAVGAAFGGIVGALTAYSIAERHSPIPKLRQDALNGNVNAQVVLGMDYDFGHGVGQNYEEAAKWYQLAVDRGNPIAQNNLGSFFQYGLGGKYVDYGQAAALYQPAAEQGFPPAQSNLGFLYDYGLGVSTNKVLALKWYRDAADQGYPDGMMNLGVCYREGDGVTLDPLIAYMWIECARRLADPGRDEQAKSRIHTVLDALKQGMTPDQIKQGDVLANQWYDNFRKMHPLMQ